MERIVIKVKGGMVQDVYCSNRFVDVQVVDQDTDDGDNQIDWKDVNVPEYHVY